MVCRAQVSLEAELEGCTVRSCRTVDGGAARRTASRLRLAATLPRCSPIASRSTPRWFTPGLAAGGAELVAVASVPGPHDGADVSQRRCGRPVMPTPQEAVSMLTHVCRSPPRCRRGHARGAADRRGRLNARLPRRTLSWRPQPLRRPSSATDDHPTGPCRSFSPSHAIITG